jgi:AraC-like DNA-binding protein
MFFLGAPPLLIHSSGKGERLPQACVLNLRTHSARFETEGPLRIVSLRVRTGMLGELSHVSPEEHADACVPAELVFGPQVLAVSDHVATLSTRNAILAIHDFARPLVMRARITEPYVRQAARRLYYGAARERIAPLAAELGVTRRHLERRFLASTGLSPKTYQRIARLHHTVRELLLGHRSSYLSTALRHGFCDQAHFIHDLRELSGLRPTELLTESEFRSHFYNRPSGLDVILHGDDAPQRNRRHDRCNPPRKTRE